MSARITFCGGAGTVTGANFLFETEEQKFLIDCGILQCERVCDPANLAPFSYDPASIETLFVTHAHADHIGRIPRLVNVGFGGVIYSTAATKDLAALMYDDALRVMQEEVERNGCDMLYDNGDVERALSLWQTREYHEPFQRGDVNAEFLDAGHILGSAMVRLTRSGRSVVFTGDIGNSPEPLLMDVENAAGANYIVMESVYGDRLHGGRNERRERLRDAVEDARRRNGTLLIPSFSVERTQVLLYELNAMIEEGTIESIPVYLDAPLAIRVTEIYRAHKELFNESARERFADGRDPFSFSSLKLTREVSESEAIHRVRGPKIVIAGAGMSGGGRIRVHEKYYLSDKHAAILFVGYQTPASLGRRIQDGEKRLEIDGEHVRVCAHIETLSGYSGHADRDQLLSFVEHAAEKLERVFVTMGEPRSSLFFSQRVRDFLGIDAVAPDAGQSFEIEF